MNNRQEGKRNSSRWASRLFIVAGSFMLLNTVLLWVRFLSDLQLSILWPAIPGIIGLASGLFGLFMLYPRSLASAPILAKSGAAFALLAAASLSLGAIWLFAVSVFGAGTAEPTPQGVLVLIATFIIAMVFAYLCNAIALLMPGGQQKAGYLLAVPPAMWALVLAVSVGKGMTVGLSLDLYTHAIIAAAFFGLGFTLKANTNG